jgi:hypothetical protein
MSHYIQLAFALYSLGVIPRGGLTLVETRHDHSCPSLSTGLHFVCNCDCEIVLDGKSHLYSEFVPQGCRFAVSSPSGGA